ncbi:PaaI family thioesterase [Atopomonas sediminilitoris]|uniref:PaaI family thioesterase n=1 Tax=Atopomonas sediminilitoris TaxID=2919919 RepID=UPI001F4D8E20|nr:PaaI family thioesterase [Atopomonas sediminilitoris]MCJ8169376.1 PaaI family thioesterase [Atopomonas sediminilitoris]
MSLPAGFVGSPFSQHLGIQVLAAADGCTHLQMTVTPELRNLSGMLHGGALMALADTAMGLACFERFGADQPCVTVECKLNFIRPVADGVVDCHARILHNGKRTLVLEAEVIQHGKLVVKTLATFARLVSTSD